MSQTKIDVGMISATGTASSSTVLKGDGTWGSGSPITLISDTDISNAASFNFTGFASSKYDSYEKAKYWDRRSRSDEARQRIDKGLEELNTAISIFKFKESTNFKHFSIDNFGYP